MIAHMVTKYVCNLDRSLLFVMAHLEGNIPTYTVPFHTANIPGGHRLLASSTGPQLPFSSAVVAANFET